MLLGGDERGRSQYGNNNAWCQDNEISWFEWKPSDASDELYAFTRRLIALRHHHPVFRRESFLIGSDEADAAELPDAWWFRRDGLKMTKSDWQTGEPVLGLFLNGEAIPTPGPRGERIVDDSFLALFNACPDERTFTLPRARLGEAWELELSTAEPGAAAGSASFAARSKVTLLGRSLVLLKRADG
jgi:glycogen operon protein